MPLLAVLWCLAWPRRRLLSRRPAPTWLRSTPNGHGTFPPKKRQAPGTAVGRQRRSPRILNCNRSTRIRVGRIPFSSSSHCAGWEWEAARRLRLIAADPTLPDSVYKVEGFNAASVAARARQDWSRTLDELAKASNTLARAARAMPDDARTQEWLSGR